MRDRLAPVALGGDDRFDVGFRQFLTDGVDVIALVGQQRLNLVCDHAEQRTEALDVVGLPWCQDKSERAAFGIASGVEFGAEATARSAKRLGLLIPFFMPTAQ